MDRRIGYLSSGTLWITEPRVAVITEQRETTMKRALHFAALLAALTISGGAFAQGNSEPGLERYNNNPGREQAQSHVGGGCTSSAAGAGAFGYFGKDNNLAGGADGQQTGLNNSSLCGNRQGNLPN